MKLKCGTAYKYNEGCRCDLCKKAKSDYNRMYRNLKK